MKQNIHMDGHKLFWHADRVHQWQSGELIAPIYVEVSPLSICNHRCVFCGVDFARNDHFTLEAKVLEQRIREMGALGVRSIMFAGEGEPFLHPALASLVTTAKDSGIDVSITTNGSAGARDAWEKIIPQLSWIRFSIDAGTPETYAKVHGVAADSFRKTLDNVAQAVAIKKSASAKTTIGVQYLLLGHNMGEIQQAIQLFDSLGVDYISFKPYSEHPQMLNKSGFNYTAEMLAEVERIIEASRPSVSAQLIYRKNSATHYQQGNMGFTSCHALPFWGYISSKGDFHTCSVFLNDERFMVGNIYQQDMQAIILGERRRQSIEYGCTRLHSQDECRLNCRMARANEYLSFLSNVPDHINFI